MYKNYQFDQVLGVARYFEAMAYRDYANGKEGNGDYAAKQAERYYEGAALARKFEYVSYYADKWNGWNSQLG